MIFEFRNIVKLYLLYNQKSSKENRSFKKPVAFGCTRSGPSSRSNFGAAALTVGAVAAVGGRGLLLQRRATAVKKKGVRVVEGKEKSSVTRYVNC